VSQKLSEHEAVGFKEREGVLGHGSRSSKKGENYSPTNTRKKEERDVLAMSMGDEEKGTKTPRA